MLQIFLLGFVHMFQPQHAQVWVMGLWGMQSRNWWEMVWQSLLLVSVHLIVLSVYGWLLQVSIKELGDWGHVLEYLFAIVLIGLGFSFLTSHKAHEEKCTHTIHLSSHAMKWAGASLLLPCPTFLSFFLTELSQWSWLEMMFSLIGYGLGIYLSVLLGMALFYSFGRTKFADALIVRYIMLAIGLFTIILGLYQLWGLMNETHVHV